LRLTLDFLAKLTLTPAEVTAEDVRVLKDGGVPEEAIRQAIYICAGYNIIDRVADAMGFALLDEGEKRGIAKYLLRIGYRV